eukprot:3198262-Prymnesium_polylepis.1
MAASIRSTTRGCWARSWTRTTSTCTPPPATGSSPTRCGSAACDSFGRHTVSRSRTGNAAPLPRLSRRPFAARALQSGTVVSRHPPVSGER